MGYKAQLLEFAKEKATLFVVPRFYKLVAHSYTVNKAAEITKYNFDSNTLVVRSSASDEDTDSKTLAGEYESILNVPLNDPEKISSAIIKVINSYKKKRPVTNEDAVIVQDMVKNTIMSGVIFTHDLNTGAPYYVINYDDKSGDTDTVTSGNGEYSNRTLYIHRNSVNSLCSQRFKILLKAVQELEKIMDSQFLDIEFALDKNLTPFLLQVRAITTRPNWNRAVAKRIDSTLKGVQLFVAEKFKSFNGVHGKTTLFGQMPDWNPVEMIGRAPRALSISLYRALITDYAWSRARSLMGYKVPTGHPLMLTLAGQPFIDTRLSFHSYLPKSISTIISEKLVNHWVESLRQSPELHDKIEFEVAITAYSFDIDERIEKLIGCALTSDEKKEFKQAHFKQTKSLISEDGRGSIKQALKKINTLKNKQKKFSNTEEQHNLLSLFTMTSDCIQYGTIPFSILARHGFIAKTILISIYHLGIMTKNEIDQFQASIHTVASNLVSDIHSLKFGELTNAEFMQSYGHLRPGTYDIISHRYDQMGDIYDGDALYKQKDKAEEFKFSKQQQQQINTLLEDNGFNTFKAEDLLNYIREATIGREYGKFIFTRSVSNMLEIIASFAEDNGLSRDEISHVPFNSILDIEKASGERSIEERLRGISECEKERHQISMAIRLPQLLTDQASVHIVPFQVSHPNFITHKKVIAPCLILRDEVDKIHLKGKIIIIEGADPGFDWIFSQKIAGLITKYGGANSHMAIRCAEFGIPAAIGCGEQRYDLLLKSNKVHLDCAAGLINSLH
mgnify:FL=1|jgi:glutamine kinase